MTIDDSSSVYVGGLSFDSTENTLWKCFEEYGEIKAVKLVLDSQGQPRGYGFVTFSNHRAAADAIHRMDGKAIGGRTVKVNEVKNKASRMTGHDLGERDRDNRDRDNRMNRYRDRTGRGHRLSPVRNRRPSPRSFRSSRGRSPLQRHSRSPRKGHSRSGSRGRHGTDGESLPSPGTSDRLHYSDDPRGTPKVGGSISKDKDLDRPKLKDELERSLQKIEELQEQVSLLESHMDRAEERIADLQSTEQRLEESLANAQAAASHRCNQLQRLRQAVLEVNDYRERLKCSEAELEKLIMMAPAELEDAKVGKYHKDKGDERRSPKEGN